VYEAQELQEPEVRVALKQTFNPILPRYLELFMEQGKGYLAMELIGGQALN
jgi:hypothetical protein